MFKSIYFPADRTERGLAIRRTVNLVTAGDEAFRAWLAGLSSWEIRSALGDPTLETLERQATLDARSLSNAMTRSLQARFDAISGARENGGEQLALGFAPAELTHGLTFRDSRKEPVHRWYPYVEGFSASYVRNLLVEAKTRRIFDPFGGAGTAQLEAARLGIPSYYCEINPFMSFVAETKVASSTWARENWSDFREVATAFIDGLTGTRLAAAPEPDLDAIERAFPERGFFEVQHLRNLLAARDLAIRVGSGFPAARDLLLLACASVAVDCSNMTRRADLRRRRADEYKERVVDVGGAIRHQLARMLEDIPQFPERSAPMVKVSSDAKAIPDTYDGFFELSVTSPPYLNGTNYFRNTKIELWLLGFIETESELGRFRREAVAGGINNVTRDREPPTLFPAVEAVATRLDETATDRRIPLLVRHYFSDMAKVLAAVGRTLVPAGRFHLDIGDSKFYGVHVPTHDLLAAVARQAGFEVDQPRLLARRHSRDKSPLVQVELVLRKPRRSVKRARLPEVIEAFGQALPHREAAYANRAWGHPLHSLCSYQGKIKPSLAYWLVRTFVPAGGSVLDPLGGVGTIPLEAALAGHPAISNDLSPFPALVATAKLDPPSLPEVNAAIDGLAAAIRGVKLSEGDRADAKFGLNGSVADYYDPETLHEVLAARRLLKERPPDSRAERFMWAAVLHVLHGNRPYALSRKSHPITPFRPTGSFAYRSLVAALRARVARTLATPLPMTFVPGTGFEGDFRQLPSRNLSAVDSIITSPPFIGMRFDRPNWLRLWFVGWGDVDFHERSRDFLERQQVVDTGVYRELFEVSRSLLKRNGLLVVHMGSGSKGDLVGDLRRYGDETFLLIGEVVENVQDVEQHGIRDKGLTDKHHVLVFEPR